MSFSTTQTLGNENIFLKVKEIVALHHDDTETLFLSPALQEILVLSLLLALSLTGTQSKTVTRML